DRQGPVGRRHGARRRTEANRNRHQSSRHRRALKSYSLRDTVMWISDTSIKRPVFATMVIVSFMVLGIVSLGRLGIDLFPEVNFPFVNISIVYPGAGPEEVETLVTRPIEDAVAGINGVKRVISTSTEGFSRVGIE